MIGMALDIMIVVLLAVTISYCWRLNRRIRILQDGKGELAQLLKHFDESTQRASESIIALQTASKKIGENIQFRIDKANYIVDDLAVLIEKGGKLADRMEAGFAVSRARARAQAMQEEHEPEVQEAPEPPLPVEEKPVRPTVKPLSSREKTSASLEAVLERVMGRNTKPIPANDETVVRERPQQPQVQSPSRSRAEQELLDMIKAGIKG